MAGPSFGIGVALALARRLPQKYPWLLRQPRCSRPEGPHNDSSKIRTKTKARKRACAARQPYPILISFDPGGAFLPKRCDGRIPSFAIFD